MTLDCRLPSSASELQGVRRRLDDVAADFGLGASGRFEFVFAVNEAVTNAITHGKPDQDGTVGLRVDADGDSLICSVYDSGRFRQPTAESDPLAERGRGFTLMALLMDEIGLSTGPDGTTVWLVKRRPTESPGSPG